MKSYRLLFENQFKQSDFMSEKFIFPYKATEKVTKQ